MLKLKIKPELFKSAPAPGWLLSHSELLYYNLLYYIYNFKYFLKIYCLPVIVSCVYTSLKVQIEHLWRNNIASVS